MKRSIIALAAALALPASAAQAQDTTPTPKESASQACKAERDAMGVTTFRATYGTNKNKKNAFGKCVSKREATVVEDTKEAKNTCKTEQQADKAAFEAKYGTNKNKKNAYGKCVSAKTEEAAAKKTEADVSAAKSCKAERKLDADAFKAKYGTNKSKSNAFGKCVSTTAKAKQQEQETEEPAPVA